MHQRNILEQETSTVVSVTLQEEPVAIILQVEAIITSIELLLTLERKEHVLHYYSFSHF